MHPDFDLICEENRQLFKLIVTKNLAKNRRCSRGSTENLICHLALCRLFEERYDELKDKVFGNKREKEVEEALLRVGTTGRNLVRELRLERGFSDEEIETMVQGELAQIRLIFKI